MARYESYWKMAEAIFSTVEKEGLDGILPIDNPSELTMGYVAALPPSKRKEHHHWCIYLANIQDVFLDPRYPKVSKRLAALTRSWRSDWI